MDERTDDILELPKFVRAAEVAELLECSESKAYKIIQKLNKELAATGSITVAGRVSRRYLMERLYC
ncbi:MAG: transcriptional regulator [Firmicutes bacterium]|nr:transcriptional regulator [Bacillota bacterium]